MSDEEDTGLYDSHPQGYELEGEGSQDQTVEESETTVLFGRLGDELHHLVQRYNMPSVELEELFQVVQDMFALMDADQVSLAEAHRERKEIELLWKQEKDQRKRTQQKKLDLECRLEEEQMRRESERMDLEKEKALLSTRVKQLQEHKSSVEQDLTRLKEKMSVEEIARRELLEQYKKQAEMAKNGTLKRRGKDKDGKRRLLPTLPRGGAGGWSQDSFSSSLNITPSTQYNLGVSVKSENFLESTESTTSQDARDEAEFRNSAHPSSAVAKRLLSSPSEPPCSLAEELEKEEQRNSTGQLVNGNHSPVRIEYGNRTSSIGSDSLEVEQLNTTNEGERGGAEGAEEGGWSFTPEEEESFFEEMLAVDPLMRTEVEMLQKEKESWQIDQRQLEREKVELREQKEALERLTTQLQVELTQMKTNQKDLQDKLFDVKKERDEILDNYLEQPFDEYCITRKELHELLMKHQNTAFELEQAREEKHRLEKELESRRTFFERLREKWKRYFGPKPTSSASEDNKVEMVPRARSTTLSLPVVRDLSSVMESERFVIKKEWLMSGTSEVVSGNLPHWMGQITLKGVEVERIECSVVGRVFQSPIRNLPPNFSPPKVKSPQQQLALMSNMQQLHAEVWVATIEASTARIEIIDVIARPPKMRQRFVIKPKTAHIVCMRSVPGKVDESNDFVDSAMLSHDTEWMDLSFVSPNRRSSYLGPRVSFKGRPHSAPKERLTKSLMMSTPNLSLSSVSDPGPLLPYDSPDVRSRPRKQKHGYSELQSHDPTDSSSSTCSLTTIDEVLDTTDKHPLLGSSPSSSPREHRTKEQVTRKRVGKVKPASMGAEERKKKEKSEEKQKSEMKRAGSFEELGMEFVDGSRGGDSTVTAETGAGGEGRGSKVGMENEEDPLPPLTSTPTSSSKIGGGAGRKYTVSERLQEVPKFRVEEVDYDCTDGGDIHSTSEEDSPVMWIITESNDLMFYPTTDPSHRPLNRKELKEKAVCMEYMKGGGDMKPRVFIGHSNSSISIYHVDEFRANVWDIENPEKITLPCANPNEQHEVKCIACVEDRIWVGVGPSIFFLNAEHPEMREGSIFLDNYRRKPEKMLSLENMVIVSTKGSIFYVFDSHSAQILQKFDVSPITHHLDLPIPLNLNSEPRRVISAPTDIKTMVSDGIQLYVGTSNGKVVSIPISSLRADSTQEWCIISQGSLEEKQVSEEPLSPKSTKEKEKKGKHWKGSPKHRKGRASRDGHGTKSPDSKSGTKSPEVKTGTKSPESKDGMKSPETDGTMSPEVKNSKEETKSREAALVEMRAHSLVHSAVAVHSHMDERVRDLLFLRLPEMKLSKLKQAAEMMQYHSLPNLASPLGGRIPISPPILSFRSLVISVGKGHVEYVAEKGEESGEDGGRHRERHEAFQLLIWGHKNLVAS